MKEEPGLVWQNGLAPAGNRALRLRSAGLVVVSKNQVIRVQASVMLPLYLLLTIAEISPVWDTGFAAVWEQPLTGLQLVMEGPSAAGAETVGVKLCLTGAK